MSTKHLLKEFKASGKTLAENRIRVVASTVGNPDRMGDVIMPGAFGKTEMKNAVKSGWLDVGHSWDGKPVGYLTEVVLEGDSLVMEAEFHSTPSAQEARTIVTERLAAGKTVDVSIGFMPDYESVRWFEKGEQLLEWIEDEGYDLAQFDAKEIKRLGWCRAIPKVAEIFEVSVCNVGMNRRAKATEAKDLDPDDEPLAGKSLESDLESALAAVLRAKKVDDSRKSDGRRISAERLTQLEAIRAEIDGVLAQKVAESDQPDPSEIEALTLRSKTLLTLAK